MTLDFPIFDDAQVVVDSIEEQWETKYERCDENQEVGDDIQEEISGILKRGLILFKQGIAQNKYLNFNLLRHHTSSKLNFLADQF